MNYFRSYDSRQEYHFSLLNNLYLFSPSQCQIEQIATVDQIYLNSEQYKEVCETLSQSDVNNYIKNIYPNNGSFRKNDWLHVNIILPQIPKKDLTESLLNIIESIVKIFKDNYSGITVGLRSINSVFEIIDSQFLFNSFDLLRNKYIETYPYVYLNNSLITNEIFALLKNNKCCWEIQNFDSTLLDFNSIGHYEDMNLESYFMIKSSTGYNNKGIHIIYDYNKKTYLEVFLGLYQIGYGYPISIDPFFCNFNKSDIDKIMKQYEIFIDFLLDCISGLKFGQLESFFNGRSMLSNIIKGIIYFPDKSVRPENLLFSPAIDFNGSVFYNFSSNDELWSIGNINEGLNFEKIQLINQYAINNFYCCNKCNIKLFCPLIFTNFEVAPEYRVYRNNKHSCLLIRKIIELSFVFYHKARNINLSALKYSCVQK